MLVFLLECWNGAMCFSFQYGVPIWKVGTEQCQKVDIWKYRFIFLRFMLGGAYVFSKPQCNQQLGTHRKWA